jgi:predicted RNA binding protein YcfA (HicA-like mRNA interferase family)
MTSRLPTCTARQVLGALQKAGWQVIHVKGSHHRLVHLSHPSLRVTIAVHPGDIPRPLLARILKQADLTEEEFRKLL